MKKILFAIAAVAMSLTFNSCTEKAAEGSAQSASASAASVSQQDAEQPAQSISEILDAAKAEGANWSTEKWEEQLTNAMKAYKPFAVAFAELMKDPTADGVQEKAAQLEKDYPKYPEMMNELFELAAKTDAAKATAGNQEWIANKMKELGIPDLH